MTSPSDLQAVILQLRVIVVAMIFGVVAFLGITFVVDLSSGSESNDFLVTACVVVAAAVAGARSLVSRAIVKRLSSRAPYETGETPPPELLGGFRQWTIVRAAMAEFTGLFAGVAVLLTGSTVALTVAGLAVVVLASDFPSAGRLERFEAAVAAQGAA